MKEATEKKVLERLEAIEDMASKMKRKTSLVSHVFRKLGTEEDRDVIMICLKGLADAVEELDSIRLDMWSNAYSALSAIEKDEESKEEVKEEDGKDV